MKRIVHNFVNPHMQLVGMTPAEKDEIKWLFLHWFSYRVIEGEMKDQDRE